MGGFFEADEDGSGGLDIDEFLVAFQPHFPSLNEDALRHLNPNPNPNPNSNPNSKSNPDLEASFHEN